MVCLRRLDKTPSPRGNTGMPPAATPTSMHTNIIPLMAKPTEAAATLKELRFPSPGLRAKHATLGKHPTNLATLQELRLAVGVTRSRIMGCYLVEEIIGLRITPSAKRNTYSVAMMVGWACTQGSVLSPATLGWGNATPSELLLLEGATIEAPPQPSPRGGSPILLSFRRLRDAPSPWGRLGWGPWSSPRNLWA